MSLINRFEKLSESERKELCTVIFALGTEQDVSHDEFRASMKRFMRISEGNLRQVYKELHRLEKSRLNKFFASMRSVNAV